MTKNCSDKSRVCGNTCIRKSYKCRFDAQNNNAKGLETLAGAAKALPKRTVSKKSGADAREPAPVAATPVKTSAVSSLSPGLVEDLTKDVARKNAAKARKLAKVAKDKATKDKLLFNADVWDAVVRELNANYSSKIAATVKDSNGETAAGILYSHSKKGTEIDYLVASPESLAGTGVKGAGTQAVVEVLKIATAAHKKGVKVVALKDAIGFYQKLGFKIDAELGSGDADMSISHAQALKLIDSKK